METNTKKAQITVFIIIGIVILLTIGILFILINLNSPENSVTDNRFAQPVDTLIENCFKDAAEPGIFLLAQNGGYIYTFEPNVLMSYQRIAYHYKNNKLSGPDIHFMENELSKFVADSVKICVNDFQAFPYLNFNDKDMNVKTTISDEAINIDLDYPVQVLNGDTTKTLSEHTVSINQPLGRIVKQKDNLISKMSDKIDLNELSSYGLNIAIMPIDESILVYSISDAYTDPDEVPLVFNFAVEVSINSPPKLEFIPDFVMKTGDTLTFYANATDEDGDTLHYFSDINNILVNQRTGKVSFTSTTQGTIEANICVKDAKDRDCQEVKIQVNNE